MAKKPSLFDTVRAMLRRTEPRPSSEELAAKLDELTTSAPDVEAAVATARDAVAEARAFGSAADLRQTQDQLQEAVEAADTLSAQRDWLARRLEETRVEEATSALDRELQTAREAQAQGIESLRRIDALTAKLVEELETLQRCERTVDRVRNLAKDAGRANEVPPGPNTAARPWNAPVPENTVLPAVSAGGRRWRAPSFRVFEPATETPTVRPISPAAPTVTDSEGRDISDGGFPQQVRNGRRVLSAGITDE